jgi:hypothetical protein
MIVITASLENGPTPDRVMRIYDKYITDLFPLPINLNAIGSNGILQNESSEPATIPAAANPPELTVI